MKSFLKLLAGMLTGICLCSSFPANAEDITVSENFTSEDGLWTCHDYGDGTVSVTCTDNTVTEAVIPSEIKGHVINMVELDCFKDNPNLKKVTLPETITVLEDYAFYLCSGLEEINIPEKLKKFGFQTFYGCSSLKEITVPATVEEIEGFTFEGCNSLEAVHVEKGNAVYKDEDGILFTADGSELILYPSAKQGTSYKVPENCKKLESYAFMANTYLEEIDISNVSEIGGDVFYYCTALKSMTIPEGVTTLNGAVFGNCTSLESVSLPSTLESIGSGCFFNCLKLSSVAIPDSVTTISSNAFFNCASLTSVKVSANVTTIGDYAFGFYSNQDEKPEHLPDFTLDAENGTPAFDYAYKFGVKCTGGITQGIVFVYIMIGIVAVVILAVIGLLIIQKRIQKRHELT